VADEGASESSLSYVFLGSLGDVTAPKESRQIQINGIFFTSVYADVNEPFAMTNFCIILANNQIFDPILKILIPLVTHFQRQMLENFVL
jgi:hypothetical protein